MDARSTARGERRPAAWRSVTRGAIRRSEVDDVFTAELRAWACVLPPYASFTHVTAARLLGLWLPPLPAVIPVFVQLPAGSTKPDRPGLRPIRSEEAGPAIRVADLHVAGICDVLLALCRDLSELDALVAVDSALHLGLVDEHQLLEACRQRRRGVVRLRRVVKLADARSESPWETLLREFHRSVGAAVTPQYEVRDADGLFVARGDLRLDGLSVLHEYDGSHHLGVDRQRHDLRRARRLLAAGWDRRGYTSQDLVHRAASLLRDIDQSLGRPHDPSRIRPWHDALRSSGFSVAGRSALAPRLGL